MKVHYKKYGQKGDGFIKRPMVWVCTVCILLFALYRFYYGEQDDKRYYIYGDALVSKGCNVKILGRVDRMEQKKLSYYLYLRDVLVTSNLSGVNHTHLSKLILSCAEAPDLLPGYQIEADGTLCDFEAATNPGQFDAKSYYRERGYYYILYEKNYTVVSARGDPYRTALLSLKQRLQYTIQSSLPQSQAGIVQTMLLGDKSALDQDVRQLYQQNGIGHLLAISGLHITILCMAFYQILLFLRFPPMAAVPITIVMLWSYGELTGFSVSTNRAIIMMVLYLFAGLLGRSYDLLSAMACSALLILLQKPFAITSCSFLLSYAAVMGVGLVYPVLQECILGDEKQRRRRKRSMHRKERECKAAGWYGQFHWWFLSVRESMMQTLLMSVAIQISTLPVMLYFYYEVPTYGIFLNILTLPLASLLITLAATASLVGLFLPLVAKFLFGTVSLILSFYEMLCSIFVKLPMPLTLIGRPSVWRLAGYILCGALAVWLWQRFCVKRIPLYLWAIGTIFLILPPLVPSLSITFLDVGQGDGIVLHTSDDVTILIDGGSSSEKQVGEYRIKPFLKFHGIDRIDYMVMSHADEDHISGQKELLENHGKPGEIQIQNLLLPEPAEEYQQEEGYLQILQLAQEAGVPVRYIHSGDRLAIRDLDVLCLHPDAGFDGGSANAYSTSLSISWQGLHFLLCGDLEKTGEDAVIRQLSIQSAESNGAKTRPMDIPDHYDILKVSHHGSKNSTPDELLAKISPTLSVISCGRDNRYGHPHQELLERLERINTRILRTDTQGAIKLIFTYPFPL